MGWGETVRTALSALNSRRMRTLLTLLGIMIGISAVMLTVGLGQGAQIKITEQINKLGSNQLIVLPGSSNSAGQVQGSTLATTLTATDAAILADPAVAPDVAAVAPVSNARITLRSETDTWTVAAVGTVPEWTTVRAKVVQHGRFFTQTEVDASASVVVLGSATAANLFGAEPALGRTVIVEDQAFIVIGVLESSGSNSMVNEDDQIVIPRTTFANRVATTGDTRAVSAIYLQARDADSLSAARQQVTKALITMHRTTVADQDFEIMSYAALVSAAATMTGVLTALLGGIAAISLLVGGIGVMNIMLVSVSERVREIGLRKALGATPSVIRRQFLVEAGILGLIGGVLGILLGMLGAAILTPLLQLPVTLSWSATLIALGVSLTIGVIAGVYPASRAARMAPIDALRSE